MTFIYILKVRNTSNGQWRTIKNTSQEKHESDKVGFTKFGWLIVEEKVKKDYSDEQLKLDL